jgi:hypothetical protein
MCTEESGEQKSCDFPDIAGEKCAGQRLAQRNFAQFLRPIKMAGKFPQWGKLPATAE